jgi:hypothetical protein
MVELMILTDVCYQTLLTGGVQDTAESPSARQDKSKGKAKETNEMDVDEEEGDEPHPTPAGLLYEALSLMS